MTYVVSLAIGLAAATLLVPARGAAQGLPFHTETAITAGFQENAARSFISFLGRSGLVEDGTEIDDPMAREIDVVAVPFGVIPISFSPFWSTRVVVPYIDKAMDFASSDGGRMRFHAAGVGDVLVDTKWVFLRANRRSGVTRVGVQGGVTIPVGETDARLPDGAVAPRPLQLGSGSWDVPLDLIASHVDGRWGLSGNIGYRLNTEDGGFDAGDAFGYDVALGFRLAPHVYESLSDQTVVAYLELNGTVSDEDRIGGARHPDSGGHLLFVSPDLQWVPTPWLLLEGSAQFPVVQDLNGVQVEHEPRFQLGTRIRFSVLRGS